MNKTENILVIEDSKTMNNIIKSELDKMEYNITQAWTFADAKLALSKKTYDLIILDLHLPDGEGFELIANIQSLTKTKVIVLTSNNDSELREELFEYGILDYIIKDQNLAYSMLEIKKVLKSLQEDHKGNILVIDDSRVICNQISTIIEPRNYKVITSLNAKDGMIKLLNDDYKLIILDMELPDIHGLKVLEMIRRNKKFLELPIIVLSGTSNAEIIRDSLKNGASDFFKKPFVFEELILKVDLWTDYSNKANELQYLNQHLKSVVAKEVQQNQEKDKMMFQQSRLAQMGEMIAMIAHQWRQPLNNLSLLNQLLVTKYKQNKLDDKTVNHFQTSSSKQIEMMSNTIDDFRNFFKTNKNTMTTNLKTIYEKVVTIVGESIKQTKINLITDIKDDIEDINTYESEMMQVVLNIIKNAQDVLLEKKISNPTIKVYISQKTCRISDNAGGIPDVIIDQIFDPYFSTKTNKDGTGLGLYMSKTIVEQHCNGKLSVRNDQDGAVFTIKL
jgi:DNA-binding response OmpR family regulator